MTIRRLNTSMARSFFPPRPRKGHKGSFGRVYIVAGSRGMVGAGVLCSVGAFRVGAGLVRLGTVESQLNIAAKRAPLEVTTEAFPEDRNGQLAGAAKEVVLGKIRKFEADVVALGPGLGQGQGGAVGKSIRGLLLGMKRPTVLDADGLNAFSGHLSDLKQSRIPLILTPHPGELARLANTKGSLIQANRIHAAVTIARKLACVCVLKGAQTIVTDGRRVFQNTTGNSGMASGGTGDVLTGIIAGLWGQMPQKDLAHGIKAAVLGVYLHGMAGDLAARALSEPGMLASDLAERLPLAIKKVLR